jgi:hypothetical protein
MIEKSVLVVFWSKLLLPDLLGTQRIESRSLLLQEKGSNDIHSY